SRRRHTRWPRDWSSDVCSSDLRLPGIGSYMSVALDQGYAQAMALAIAAMVAMIVCVDQLLWRPLVVWVEKFRLDESSGGGPGPRSEERRVGKGGRNRWPTCHSK